MTRQQNAKVLWVLSGFLMMTSASIVRADITPEEALQIARNYAGNPNLSLRITLEESGDFLKRSRQCYELSGKASLSFSVDKATGRLFAYSRDYQERCLNTPPDAPVLNDDALLARARELAAQVYPDFAQYQWEARDRSRDWEEFQGRRSQNFRVWFVPYFINAQGEKVLFVANALLVAVDSHSGQLNGFNHFPESLSVAHLTPHVTRAQAEELVVQHFFAIGAARVTPIMSVTGSWDFETIPDGLVIGDDDIGQQRLLWVFDVVQTEGAPGFEERWGTAENPFWFWVAVDAQTGGVFLLDEYLGGNKKLIAKQSKRPTTFEAKGNNKNTKVVIPRIQQGGREIKLFGGVKVEGQTVWMARGVVEKLSGVKVTGQGKQAEVVLADGRRVKCSLKDSYLSLSQIAKSLGVRITWQGNEVFVVYPERTGKPLKEQKPQGQRKTMGFTAFFALVIGCSVVAYTVYATTRKKPMVTRLSTSAKADS